MSLRHSVKSEVIVLFALLVSLGFVLQFAFGQETVLRGIVHDQQGNLLQKVKITILDTSRGTKFTLNSNKKGEFIKIGIPPSSYKITFELEGFFPFESQLAIGLGMQETLDITLKKIPPKIDEDKDFNEGIDFFKQGKYKEAIDSFIKVADKFPESAEAYYNLGLSYLRNGNSESAITTLEKAIELDPAFSSAYYQAGLANIKKGDLGKAIKYFEEFLKLEPNASEANQVKAMIEELRKQIKLA